MSWEHVEHWPTGQGHGSGPFRGSSEPIVAERVGLPWWERWRLYFASSPEFPYRETVKRVAMTKQFLYVETVAGVRQRVAYEAMGGTRWEGDFRTYGILEGSDLRLLSRVACPVIHALDAKQPKAPYRPWAEREVGFVGSFLLLGTCILFAFGCFLFMDVFSPTDDTSISDWIYGVLWGGFFTFVSILMFFFLPSRLRVDTLGVTRVVGVFPLLKFFLPREEVAEVDVKLFERTSQNKGRMRTERGLTVGLCFSKPRRFATLLSSERIIVQRWTFKSDELPEKKVGRALALAHRLAVMLGVPVRELDGECTTAMPAAFEQQSDEAHLGAWSWRALVWLTKLGSASVLGCAWLFLGSAYDLGFFSEVVLVGALVVAMVGWAVGGRICRAIDAAFRGPAMRETLRVNLTTANRAQLQCLPEIGPWRSFAIVQARTEQPFTSIDDLLHVQGMELASFTSIRPYLTLTEETDVSSTRVRAHCVRRLWRFVLFAMSLCVVAVVGADVNGFAMPLEVWTVGEIIGALLAAGFGVFLSRDRALHGFGGQCVRFAFVGYVLCTLPATVVVFVLQL